MRPRSSLVPVGVTVRGTVDGEGDLIVAGRVDGPIRIVGALLIAEGGIVKGHVHARAVTVRGVLKGDAFGDEVVRVEESARLVGDVRAPRIKVVRGAQLAGKLHMGEIEEPSLSGYDPARHTFTGQPSPAPAGQTQVLDIRGDGFPTAIDVLSPAAKPRRVRPSSIRALAEAQDTTPGMAEAPSVDWGDSGGLPHKEDIEASAPPTLFAPPSEEALAQAAGVLDGLAIPPSAPDTRSEEENDDLGAGEDAQVDAPRAHHTMHAPPPIMMGEGRPPLRMPAFGRLRAQLREEGSEGGR